MHNDIGYMNQKHILQLLEIFKAAPKPQLHLHLDGSLPGEFILGKYKANKDKLNIKLQNDVNSVTDLRNQFMNMKQQQFKNDSQVQRKQNWPVFDFCNQFLQTQQDLTQATQMITENLFYNHNVNLIEIRFAPILHRQQGLTLDQAIQSVIQGFSQAKTNIKTQNNQDIYGGIILCALRSYQGDHSMETVKYVKKYYQQGVIGFDLAGDEGSYPLEIHKESFLYAKQNNINTTCHAGEWNESYNTLSNIELAINIGCKRIGHGLVLRSDHQNKLINDINNRNIGIEICLTSNCGNPSKCEWFDNHPLPELLQKQVKICGLNVDNSLLSGSQQTGMPVPEMEYVRAYLDCKVSIDQIIDNIIYNGYKLSFDDSIPNEFVEKQIDIWKKQVKLQIQQIN